MTRWIVPLLLASLLFVADAHAAPASLPCSTTGGNGMLVLQSRPARCLTLSRTTMVARSVRLRELRWTGWGRSASTASGRVVPFGGGRSLAARVRADRLERDACSGRLYYSHLVVTTSARTQRVWVAPGCEFTRRQRTFRDAVRTRLAQLPGRVVFVNDARCTFDSPGIWSCTATGDREYTERPGVIRTCIYAARGHYTGSRVVLAPLRCRRLV